MAAGQLRYHLRVVPGGVVRLVNANPTPEPNFNFPQPSSRQEILKTFGESIATVRDCLSQADDASMNESWRLTVGGREVLTQPRGLLLRAVMLTHWSQHRGQYIHLRHILRPPDP